VDAGDIGAGHTVTALYEVVPFGVNMPDVGQVTPSEYVQPVASEQTIPLNPKTSPNWLTVRLRHKKPEGDKSELQKFPLAGDPVVLSEAPVDFKFAAGVALFGMKLRDSEYIGDADWALVEQLTKAIDENDPHGYREELRKLVNIAKQRDE
jgi:Ca-activated chloride channel family protein